MKLSPKVYLYEAQQAAPLQTEPQLALPHIPSQAFGDGTHPTTRLMAVAVDQICRTQTISGFLDVGTGTGVLARIARARGSSFVVGTDIDPVALQAAARNADLDADADPIIFENCAPDHWGPRFDLIAANILEGPLRYLAPALARSLVPGGQLLLSGITRLQIPGLRLTYAEQGLQFLSESEHAGWALMHLQRPEREISPAPDA